MTVIFANEAQAVHQAELATLVSQAGAQALQTTPSKMRLFLTDETKLDYLKQLKLIILGGEELELSLAAKLKEHTEARIVNIYGPTEATVWATTAQVPPNPNEASMLFTRQSAGAPT